MKTIGQPNIIVRCVTNRTFLQMLLSLAIFSIIAWAYFYPDVMEGNVLKQHDVQQGVAIGQEGKVFTETTGEVSRWTNSLFSGMPNFQISPSYESSSLITWIGKVYSLGFPSPVNLVFIMMVGFYILLLSFKVKWYFAIPGAIAYAFSSYFFIIIGAGHIWKYITLAYIPPTIAGVVWAYRGRYLAGSIVAALFATLQIASNHVQMSYYFLFVIVALVIAFLVIAIKQKKVKEWGIATGGLAIAAILAVAANSPNLYHTYKYSKESMRGGHSELASAKPDNNASANGLNKDYITMWSYGIDETLSLLVPNINGGANNKPEKGSNVGLTLSSTEEAKDMLSSGAITPETHQYLSYFYQYFGDQPGTNGPVYVGALIFVLALLGCFIVKGAVKWALLAVTILSIFLSWGHNFMGLTDIFIDYFPMYNKFRTVSSILVIAEFTIPLLAILALQKIFTSPDFFKQYKKQIFGCFGFGAFICLILMLNPAIILGDAYSSYEVEGYISQGAASQNPALFAAVEQIRFHMVEQDALRSLLIIIAGLGTLLLFANRNIGSNITIGILGAIILVDLFAIDKRYLDTDSFTAKQTSAPITFAPRPADTQILQDTAMNYRVLDLPYFSEAMPSYFHKAIGGYHAAKLSRYQDIIERYVQISSEGQNINPAVMDMLNAKYVITDENTALLNSEALGNAWFVDTLQFVDTPKAEIDALNGLNPRTRAIADKKFESIIGGTIQANTPTDTIFETTYAPNRLTYHANSANGGLAVFSEVYFPWGWNVTIDGKPAEMGRVNYILRALKVPAGSHTIEFRFEPESVKTTETIAYIAIGIIYLGLAMLLILAIIGKKREKDTLTIIE